MVKPDINDPHGCTKADLPELISLVNSIFRQDSKQDILTDYPLVYRDENLANIRMMRVDGQIVSEVPFLPRPARIGDCRLTIANISPTCTHPDHRHQGYGLKCLESCLACMQSQGIELSVLWTMVPTFNFYNHAGYQAVRDQGWLFTCTQSDAALFQDHGERIVACDPDNRDHIRGIQALYSSEPYCVVRDDDETAALLGRPLMTTWLAVKGHRIVAYLCLSTSSNRPGVLEAGGEQIGLETLIYHTLGRLEPEGELNFRTYIWPTNLDELLTTRMPDRRNSSGDQQMFRIVNVPRFLRAIQPLIEKNNGGKSHAFSIGLQESGEVISLDLSSRGLKIGNGRRNPHIELSLLELTAAIFGANAARPYQPPEPLCHLFPIDIRYSALDQS